MARWIQPRGHTAWTFRATAYLEKPGPLQARLLPTFVHCIAHRLIIARHNVFRITQLMDLFSTYFSFYLGSATLSGEGGFSPLALDLLLFSFRSMAIDTTGPKREMRMKGAGTR
jgi:hypothetical protein